MTVIELKAKTPCQYTSEELRTRVEAAIKSYNERKWTSHEDMKKRGLRLPPKSQSFAE